MLTTVEARVAQAVCDVLHREGRALKARDLVARLQASGFALEKRELNAVLYRALPSFPQLQVADGLWHCACEKQVETPTFCPSDEQNRVIDAPTNAWLLVEAGPGTGKTAVACARVASMLGKGVPPSSILLVSFTRTAVAELRGRIRALATGIPGAAGVRITTLDSEAWHLGFGFRGTKAESFDASIATAIRLLRERAPDVMDWFGSIRHIIVDEAQDLVGLRSELVLQLLDTLSDDAGATVFVDPAQAIYGFSEEVDGDTSGEAVPFHQRVLDEFPDVFTALKLTRLYRTSSPELRRIFEEGRACVLADGDAGERLEELTAVARNHAREADSVNLRDDLGPNELVVFRRRAEVLTASSFLSSRGIPHRLRLSQVSLGVQPWVALVLAGHQGPLTADNFAQRWDSLAKHPLLSELDAEQAWALLLRIAGSPAGTVDSLLLRRALARARPPAELAQTEVGLRGPVLGTIHASKGREADTVTLMLPRNGRKDADREEEVRVLYVGATRARKDLLVGKGYALRRFRGLGGPGGRVFAPDNESAQVEIGRPGDVSECSVIDGSLTGTREHAEAVQRFLADHATKHVSLVARQRGGRSHDYVVETDGASPLTLCVLNPQVNADLFSIAHVLDPSDHLKPPPTIPHLYLVGCRTIALAPDDPRLGRLPEPWASTGLFLAPVIKGLAKLKMFHRKGAHT